MAYKCNLAGVTRSESAEGKAFAGCSGILLWMLILPALRELLVPSVPAQPCPAPTRLLVLDPLGTALQFWEFLNLSSVTPGTPGLEKPPPAIAFLCHNVLRSSRK